MQTRPHWIQNTAPGRLAVMPRPRGGEWLDEELRGLVFQETDLLVSLLTENEANELELADEAKFAASVGLDFLSFPITDRTIPDTSPATNDFLSELHDRYLIGDSIVVHCRMGIGRSSLVVASVLAMSGHTSEEAFEMISAARGLTVPDTIEQRAWVEAFAQAKKSPRN